MVLRILLPQNINFIIYFEQCVIKGKWSHIVLYHTNIQLSKLDVYWKKHFPYCEGLYSHLCPSLPTTVYFLGWNEAWEAALWPYSDRKYRNGRNLVFDSFQHYKALRTGTEDRKSLWKPVREKCSLLSGCTLRPEYIVGIFSESQRTGRRGPHGVWHPASSSKAMSALTHFKPDFAGQL